MAIGDLVDKIKAFNQRNPINLTREIGRRLRGFRLANGWTQEELAERSGVALSTLWEGDGDMLLRAADAALVQAKRDGRGSIGWSGPEDAAKLLRRALVLRAFDAAGNGECLAGVRAFLQPIVALGAQAGAAPASLR